MNYGQAQITVVHESNAWRELKALGWITLKVEQGRAHMIREYRGDGKLVRPMVRPEEYHRPSTLPEDWVTGAIAFRWKRPSIWSLVLHDIRVALRRMIP